MNITTKVTKTHYATCDICDAAGPESTEMLGAELAAKDEGWTVTFRWNSLEYVSTTLCPRCTRTSYEARHWAGLEEREEESDRSEVAQDPGPVILSQNIGVEVACAYLDAKYGIQVTHLTILDWLRACKLHGGRSGSGADAPWWTTYAALDNLAAEMGQGG